MTMMLVVMVVMMMSMVMPPLPIVMSIGSRYNKYADSHYRNYPEHISSFGGSFQLE